MGEIGDGGENARASCGGMRYGAVCTVLPSCQVGRIRTTPMLRVPSVLGPQKDLGALEALRSAEGRGRRRAFTVLEGRVALHSSGK